MSFSASFWYLGVLGLSASAVFAQAPGPGSASRHDGDAPNVLLILADQWNARCIGYDAGGFGGLTQSLTPRLDQLAAEGTAFTRAYAECPQCKPARWTILTGKESRVHGVRWNDVWDPPWQETIAQVFRNAGYHTAIIGKHHYPWLQQPRGFGFDHGFDEVVDLLDYHSTLAFAGIPHWYSSAHHWAMPNLPIRLAYTGYTTNEDEHHPIGFWAEKSIEFLEQRAVDSEPFFLVHSLFGPHTPILPSSPLNGVDYAHLHQPSSALDLPLNTGFSGNSPRMQAFCQEFAGMTPDDHREALSYYYGLISQIDASVGRVLDALETIGLAENTLVIFTADHGAYASEYGAWTKGGGGQEALLRIPMIMRLPHGVGGGLVSDDLVSHLDLVPTMLEVTGVPAAAEWRQDRSGASLVPLADPGVTASPWRDEFVVDFGNEYHDTMQVVVTADYKLTLDTLGNDSDLVHLQSDPFELIDLIADPNLGSVVADLTQRRDEWQGRLTTAQPFKGTGLETAQAAPAHCLTVRPSNHGVLAAGPAILMWIPSTSALLQRVWLSKEGEPFELQGILGPGANEWHLGPLVPGSRWQWRIDSFNAHGMTVGERWFFSAHPQGHFFPGCAIGPRPSNRVRLDQDDIVLRWQPSPFASSQRVWLGTDPGNLVLVADHLIGTVASLANTQIQRGKRYYWRVDSLLGPRVEEGLVWRFDTTTDGLLPPATGPRPRHLGRLGAGPVRLRANPVRGAVQYHFYGGTDYPLLPLGSSATPELTMPVVTSGERLHWRIDVEDTVGGVRTGSIWTFRVL